MTFRPLGLLAGALLALACIWPAQAQTQSSLVVRDGTGATPNVCVYNDGLRLYPCHLTYGWTGSAAHAIAVDANGAQAVQDAGGSLTVDTGTPGQFAVSVSNFPAAQAVTAAALPLPSGAATASGVAAVVTALGAPLQAGGNVVVTASALPSGAATATTQASILAAETSNVFFAPSTAPLSGSATFTGAARDVGVAAGTGQAASYFNATFYADVGGTAFLDLSDDGSSWTPAVAGVALAASTPLTLTAPILARYYRARLVNGSSAQTVLRVSTAFSRN